MAPENTAEACYRQLAGPFFLPRTERRMFPSWRLQTEGGRGSTDLKKRCQTNEGYQGQPTIQGWIIEEASGKC